MGKILRLAKMFADYFADVKIDYTKN